MYIICLLLTNIQIISCCCHYNQNIEYVRNNIIAQVMLQTDRLALSAVWATNKTWELVEWQLCRELCLLVANNTEVHTALLPSHARRPCEKQDIPPATVHPGSFRDQACGPSGHLLA